MENIGWRREAKIQWRRWADGPACGIRAGGVREGRHLGAGDNHDGRSPPRGSGLMYARVRVAAASMEHTLPAKSPLEFLSFLSPLLLLSSLALLLPWAASSDASLLTLSKFHSTGLLRPPTRQNSLGGLGGEEGVEVVLRR